MKKRNIQTIIFIVLALVLAFGLNHIYNKNPGFTNVSDDDDDDSSQTQQSQPAAPPRPVPNPGAPGVPGAPGMRPGANPAHPAPPTELILGNPASAKTKVTIGYTMDDKLQANSTPLNAVIGEAASWQKTHPTASVQIVCVDVPPGERSDPRNASVPVGVTVSGASSAKLAGNPGEGAVNLAAVNAVLNAAK